MNVIGMKASLDSQKTAFDREMVDGLKDVHKVIDEAVAGFINRSEDRLKGIMTDIDSLVAEVVVLERQRDSLTHEVQEMENVRRNLQQRKEELEAKAKELSAQEGELAEERKLLDTKKGQLAEKERQLDKQKEFWDERLKNYKIAEPKRG